MGSRKKAKLIQHQTSTKMLLTRRSRWRLALQLRKRGELLPRLAERKKKRPVRERPKFVKKPTRLSKVSEGEPDQGSPTGRERVKGKKSKWEGRPKKWERVSLGKCSKEKLKAKGSKAWSSTKWARKIRKKRTERRQLRRSA